MKSKSFLFAFLVAAFLISCKKDAERQPDTSYNPTILATDFIGSTIFTNPYFPYTPGKKYIYEGHTSEGLERIEEKRLNETKTIMGITCVVVNFKAWVNGKLVEEAWDWYAQDYHGTVWYFGEAVDNYNEQGTIEDHDGSWEAGVDGAKPGVIMPANPIVGMKYREEYFFDEAEDEAEVIETGLTVTIAFGTFNNCLKIKNFTALEPNQVEHKYYAPGIGLVKEVNVTRQIAGPYGEEIRLIAIQ